MYDTKRSDAERIDSKRRDIRRIDAERSYTRRSNTKQIEINLNDANGTFRLAVELLCETVEDSENRDVNGGTPRLPIFS